MEIPEDTTASKNTCELRGLFYGKSIWVENCDCYWNERRQLVYCSRERWQLNRKGCALRLEATCGYTWSWNLESVSRVSLGATRRGPTQPIQEECVELRSRAVVRVSPGATRRPPSQQLAELRGLFYGKSIWVENCDCYWNERRQLVYCSRERWQLNRKGCALRLEATCGYTWSWNLESVSRLSLGATRRGPTQPIQEECVELRSRAVVPVSPGATRRPPSRSVWSCVLEPSSVGVPVPPDVLLASRATRPVVRQADLGGELRLLLEWTSPAEPQGLRPPTGSHMRVYVELEPRAGLPCQARCHQTCSYSAHPDVTLLRR
ncbi:uncharacterized protein LOC119434080 [Dermacentor silvarum]|uniref:uncharacterized protein LOC119434080 n=1 Tax=Dermacentor silvarum TaxID=543639 RepID=UPI0021009310|nr:uncharacterized protein LOC119434080 [Dermacentor silvarum]